MSAYKEITACRSCRSQRLKSVFSLGNQYVIDFVKAEAIDQLRAPLDLVLCESCRLLQLKHSVNPDRLFRKFWYRSGINESMRAALRDVVNHGCQIVNLAPKDNVLDIGSNDGTLLAMFGPAYRTVGIDPCRELVEEASSNGRMDVGIAGYFSAAAVKSYGPYKLITAIAMFYDLEDPEKFLRECAAVLHREGCLIIQMNYLKLMLENMAFDNISHEHLCYYSMISMKHLVERCGLEISGASLNDVNGGSIRLYITHKGAQLNGYMMPAAQRVALAIKVDELLRKEVDMKLDTAEPYEKFCANMELICASLRKRVKELQAAGKKVYLYGASTRGTVLVQCLNMPEGTFEGAAERDDRKFGLQMVGTWTPIVSELEARQKANAFLLLPYHFWEGIRRRERSWIEAGGEFIVPLPMPVSYRDDGVFNLITGRNVEAPVGA